MDKQLQSKDIASYSGQQKDSFASAELTSTFTKNTRAGLPNFRTVTIQ